jgi:hypothetical protein
MTTIRTNWIKSFLLTAAIAGLLGLSGKAESQKNEPRSSVNGVKSFYTRSVADYGSGASIRTDWYTPGGLGGGIGVFVGHPNGLARGDRALVRFNLSPLFLKPEESISHQRAFFRFSVSNLTGKADERKIEIVHLEYDPWSFTGNDLVNTKAQVVATVTVGRKEYPGRVYSIDATKWVREDLLQGNKFCGFRFRDVAAETQGNPDLTAMGVSILFNPTTPALEINEMK